MTGASGMDPLFNCLGQGEGDIVDMSTKTFPIRLPHHPGGEDG